MRCFQQLLERLRARFSLSLTYSTKIVQAYNECRDLKSQPIKHWMECWNAVKAMELKPLTTRSCVIWSVGDVEKLTSQVDNKKKKVVDDNKQVKSDDWNVKVEEYAEYMKRKLDSQEKDAAGKTRGLRFDTGSMMEWTTYEWIVYVMFCGVTGGVKDRSGAQDLGIMETSRA